MDLNTSVMCEGAMEEARRKIGRQLAFICFICLSLGEKIFSAFLKKKNHNNENVKTTIIKELQVTESSLYTQHY